MVKNIVFSLCFCLFFVFWVDGVNALEGVDFDYYAKEIILEPTYPTVNQDVVIKIKVENKSDWSATSTLGLDTYSFDFDDFDLESVELSDITETNQLRPGLEAFYIIEGKFRSKGLKDLEFRVDSENKLNEIDENNNVVAKVIRIEEYYDLSIENIEFTPERPAVNQDVLLRVVGKNVGNKNMVSSQGLLTYSYDFPDFEVTKSSSSTIPTLDNPLLADGEFYIDFEGKFLTDGGKTLSFSIDVGDELKEFRIDDATDFVTSDENNFYIEEIDILSNDFDLVISEIEIDIDRYVVNYDTVITLTLVNDGRAAWTKPDGLVRSDYKFINDVRESLPGFVMENKYQDEYPSINNPIEPGDEYRIVYEGRFDRIGEHILEFEVDLNNRVFEINEDNNATSTIVNIYASEDDLDAFTILDFGLEYISSSSVRVNWKTDMSTTGDVMHRFKCCEFPQTRVSSDTGDDKVFEHTLVINDLKPDVGYYFDIIGKRDTVERTTGWREFWMPIDDNVKFESEPSVLVNSVNRTAEIEWSTNMSADAELYYKLISALDYDVVGVSVFASGHNIALVDLEYGDYDYYIVANSISGVSMTSPIMNFGLIEPYIAPVKQFTEDVKVSAPVSMLDTEIIGVTNGVLYEKLKGRILLKVEDAGEAWYVNPVDAKKYYLGRPRDAFNIMRNSGIGITNDDLKRIQVGDKYVPKMLRKDLDIEFAEKHKGKIFIAVEDDGEAWYVNPKDMKRYYLGRPEDAFELMRELSVGITNEIFVNL